MAAHEFRLSRPAISDLEVAADYLADRSARASDRVMDALFDTFRLIARNREIGTNLESLRPGLRMFTGCKPAENYLVFYYLVADGVMISRVIHGARDWTAILMSSEG